MSSEGAAAQPAGWVKSAPKSSFISIDTAELTATKKGRLVRPW